MSGMRRPQSVRRSPVSPLLALLDKKMKMILEPVSNKIKKGGVIASLFASSPAVRLVNANFDLARLRFFSLRDLNFQHAVFVSGFDAVLFDHLRQAKRAPELCGYPFGMAVLHAIG